MNHNEHLAPILAFLAQVGIAVHEETLAETTFLPGLRIRRGALVYDPAQLQWPGDLLHEAGHLAVVPPAERARMDGVIDSDGGQEMAAIAWSWAALVHLRLAPSVLFHDLGYRGEASALIENFTGGCFVGVPILEWRGMAHHQAPGVPQDAPRYPAMKHWLCP